MSGLCWACWVRDQITNPTLLTWLPVPGRFEKLAQDRKKQLEILQLAQAQGLDPPSHHFELKTFQTVRCQSLRETVALCRDRAKGLEQSLKALESLVRLPSTTDTRGGRWMCCAIGMAKSRHQRPVTAITTPLCTTVALVLLLSFTLHFLHFDL